MNYNCKRKEPEQCQGRISSELRIQELEKMVFGRDRVSCNSVKRVLHMKSELKLELFVNSALFQYINYVVYRNIIQ